MPEKLSSSLEIADFVPAIIMLSLVIVQFASGFAFIPGRCGFRLIPAQNRHEYRAVIILWIAAAVIWSLCVVGCPLNF